MKGQRMTTSLYQTDSYLRDFDAQITEIDQEAHAVILDQSAFYPGGGGQPNDTGALMVESEEFPVIKVKRVKGRMLHYLSDTTNLPAVGQTVHGIIDWERRYKLMRTHTALHILCGVVFRDYGAQVTGGNMEPLSGRMDFEFETMRQELVAEIEQSINQEVNAARELQIRILPREEAFQIPDLIRTKINLLPEGIKEVRVVEIQGLDLQADGGTHVTNTSEVGAIRVKDYKSKGKINKRIYIQLEN
jgi:misacylated tRNA(Ala) deacylase